MLETLVEQTTTFGSLLETCGSRETKNDAAIQEMKASNTCYKRKIKRTNEKLKKIKYKSTQQKNGSR